MTQATTIKREPCWLLGPCTNHASSVTSNMHFNILISPTVRVLNVIETSKVAQSDLANEDPPPLMSLLSAIAPPSSLCPLEVPKWS